MLRGKLKEKKTKTNKQKTKTKNKQTNKQKTKTKKNKTKTKTKTKTKNKKQKKNTHLSVPHQTLCEGAVEGEIRVWAAPFAQEEHIFHSLKIQNGQLD